jgi:hypothetical protein
LIAKIVALFIFLKEKRFIYEFAIIFELNKKDGTFWKNDIFFIPENKDFRNENYSKSPKNLPALLNPVQ